MSSHKPLLLRVLKPLGLFAALLAAYPLCYFLFFLTGAPSVPFSLLGLAAAELCGFAGAGLRRWVEKRARGRGGFRLLAAGLLAMAAVFLLSGGRLLPSLPLALLCGAAFLFGDRFILQPYDAVASRPVLAAVLTANLGCAALELALGEVVGASASFFSHAAILFLFLAVYEVSKNQSQIDYMMARRGHRMDQLPAKIRRYNLLLVCLVLAVILACFLFYRPLGSLLAMAGELLRQLLMLLIRFFLFLASLFQTEEEPLEEAAPEAPSSPMLPPGEENAGFDWLTPLALLALAGLLVWKRRQIAAAFRAAFRRLAGFLRRLLAVRRPPAAAEEAEGYHDQVEDLAREERAAPLFRFSAVRAWKKGWRSFRRMAEGEEKLRFGYALLAKGLALSGEEPLPSDTPAQLLARLRQKLPQAPAAAALEGYEQVRYGDLPASPAGGQAMEALLAALARLL